MAILRGLRGIGRYMSRSPMTILRWHERDTDPKLCFPLVPLPTGKGRGFVWISDTFLCSQWIQGMSELSATERVARLRWPRKGKRIRIGDTEKALKALTKEKEIAVVRASEPVATQVKPIKLSLGETAEPPLHDGARQKPSRTCTCGTAIECEAHNEGS